MNHPYRNGQAPTASTMEVKTNDAFVEVAYYDRAGVFRTKKREFLGHPTAWSYPYDRENPRWSVNTGRSAYNDWRSGIGTNQFVTFDDLLIPMHRVLDVVVEFKDRTVVVDIEMKE